jgi:hypothetical protein
MEAAVVAKLSNEQSQRLESELVSIFHTNPGETYRVALERIHERLPDLKNDVSISDLNYRVPKLRRAGKIPGSRRGSRATGSSATGVGAQHPVARAYQELDDAKQAMEHARRRYEQAETHLTSVLKENLPSDFLRRLAPDQNGQ